MNTREHIKRISFVSELQATLQPNMMHREPRSVGSWGRFGLNELLLKIWAALDLVEEAKASAAQLGRRDILAQLRDAERALTVALSVATK